MPDTQSETLRADSPLMGNRAQWLVDNRSRLNLQFMVATGDTVNWDTPDHSQYEVASKALDRLTAAGIPYTMALGNHDTQATIGSGTGARDPSRSIQLVRDTTVFNRYFTAQDFGGLSGQFEPGKVDNAYKLYEAGGYRWMVLTLELWPRPAAVEWARKVVAQHPGHNVIIATHSYLTGSGSIEQSNGGYGATSPQYLFDNLVKLYPNIKMVFSGHTGTSAYRVDTGVNGNKIHSMLGAFHYGSTNPVRLVEVDTRSNSIRTWVYAPYSNQTFSEFNKTFTSVGLIR